MGFFDWLDGLVADNCSEGKKPKVYSPYEVRNLKIGREQKVQGMCLPKIAGSQPGGASDTYRSICKNLYGKPCHPNNGEFVYSRYGGGCDGQLCALQYGCTCKDGAMGGASGYFKRIKYGADPLSCCRKKGTSSDGALIGNLTCDPDYRTTSGDGCRNNYDVINYCKRSETAVGDEPVCQAIINDINHSSRNAILYNYCTPDSRFFNKSVCKAWIDSNPNLSYVKRLVHKKCGTGNNLIKEPCKSFISTRAQAKSAYYDDIILEYCKRNPTKVNRECACVLSKHNEKVRGDNSKMQGRPECVDTNCHNSIQYNYGLIPSYMTDPSCNYTDCRQFVDSGGIVIGDSNKTYIQMNQECGTDVVPPGINTLNGTATEQNVKTGGGVTVGAGNTVDADNKDVYDSNTPTDNADAEKKKKDLMMFGGVFAVFLFLILTIVLASGGGDDTPAPKAKQAKGGEEYHYYGAGLGGGDSVTAY